MENNIYQRTLEFRTGLDVDGVLSNFAQALIDKANEIGLGEHFPKSWRDIDNWFFSDKIPEVFELIKYDEQFWLDIEPLTSPDKILFKPVAYVTARPIPSEITKRWLDKHGFPDAPVYTVDTPEEKLQILKDIGIDIFVDDKGETILDLNENGITGILFNQPHNRNFNGRCMRADCLSELFQIG